MKLNFYFIVSLTLTLLLGLTDAQAQQPVSDEGVTQFKDLYIKNEIFKKVSTLFYKSSRGEAADYLEWRCGFSSTVDGKTKKVNDGSLLVGSRYADSKNSTFKSLVIGFIDDPSWCRTTDFTDGLYQDAIETEFLSARAMKKGTVNGVTFYYQNDQKHSIHMMQIVPDGHRVLYVGGLDKDAEDEITIASVTVFHKDAKAPKFK